MQYFNVFHYKRQYLTITNFFHILLFVFASAAYFTIMYAPPGAMNRTIVFALQSASGYRPPHHPFYLYFAPESLPEVKSKAQLKKPNHGSLFQRSDLLNPNAIKFAVRALCDSESIQGEDGNSQSWSLEILDWWRRLLGQTIVTKPQNENRITVSFSNRAQETLEQALTVNFAPLRREIVLVDEIRVNSKSGKVYTFQREVAIGNPISVSTETIVRVTARYDRIFLQLPHEVGNAAVFQFLQQQLSEGFNSCDRPVGNGTNIRGLCDVSIDVTNMLPPTQRKSFNIFNENETHHSINRGATSGDIKRRLKDFDYSPFQLFVINLLSGSEDQTQFEDLQSALKELSIHMKVVEKALLIDEKSIAFDALGVETRIRNIVVDRKYANVVDPSSLPGSNRYATKTHFVAPYQAIVDYPLASAFVIHTKIEEFVSPNTISCTHLAFGIAAGMCFWLSGLRGFLERSLGDTMPDAKKITPYFAKPLELHIIRKLVLKIDARYFVWVGCCLYFFRNWLDTVDGVVARQQMARSRAPQWIDISGHTVDMVTDGLGCSIANAGILFMLYAQEKQISHTVFEILHIIPYPFTYVIRNTKRTSLSRRVAFVGLLLPGIAALVWEFHMLRITKLLDGNAGDIRITNVEQSVLVRTSWFFWSLMGGDNIVFIFIVSLLTGVAWEAIQLAAVIGYPLLFVSSVFSSFVWNFIVLRD